MFYKSLIPAYLSLSNQTKMRTIAFIFLCILLYQNASSQSLSKHGRLQVTKDGHYLQFADGTPFFWLGDTGWELFHRLKLEKRIALSKR